MITDLISKEGLTTIIPGLHSTLSFSLFLDEVKKRVVNEKTIKRDFYASILEQAEQHPDWKHEITLSRIKEYQLLFDLVYTSLFAPLSDEGEVIWGLSLPLSSISFYGTDVMNSMLIKDKIGEKPISLMLPDKKELSQRTLNEAYLLILQQVYGIPVFSKNKMIHAYREVDTGLVKQMQVHLDMRFVRVIVQGARPELTVAIPPSGNMDEETLCLLQEALPLPLFHFEGFSVISATDATEAFALESIREAMALHGSQELPDVYAKIFKQFQSVLGTDRIHFGTFPFIKLNDQFIFPYSEGNMSHLITMAYDGQVPEQEFLLFLNHYHQNPQVRYYRRGEEKDPMIARIMDGKKIDTLILVPVFHHAEVVGILEMYSYERGRLDYRALYLLDHSLALFAQLMYGTVLDITQYIDQFLKEEFTSLQPAVEWKFKEVIWNHLRDHQILNRKKPLEPVSFDQVYPLYGAIDIRNSTLERSKALNKDLLVHLDFLQSTLNKLTLLLTEEEVFRKMKYVNQLMELLLRPLSVEDEIRIERFLESEIPAFFVLVSLLHPDVLKIVSEYQDGVQHAAGVVHKNRSQLEESMQLLTSTVTERVQCFQKKLQTVFPCYFDFFRTDGVEYDIYAGQSMAPRILFRPSLLQEFRFNQLLFMTEIMKLTGSLESQMEVPLQTTQLIFVHNNPISICFRKDERRFDVEGAYNIRYQVLKKRIDKVCLKNTGERLTQPDTIAIVYADLEIETEYISYVQRLRAEYRVELSVACVELEELQGVSGLKAMRVCVHAVDNERLADRV